MNYTLKNYLRTLLPVLFVIILLAPGYVFFSSRGGITFLEGANFQLVARRIFPLVGLYAFTFLWLQFMLGSSMTPLRNLYPGLIKYHRRQGIFVFLLALLHPSLIIIGYGLSKFLDSSFLPEELIPFAFLGKVAILLLILTVVTARLSTLKFFRTKWRAIHYLNYLVFILVWIHSWNIGSDVQSTNLRYLWIFFGVTALTSLIWRLTRAQIISKKWQTLPN